MILQTNSGNRGRALVASRPFQPGDHIHTAPAFAAVLLKTRQRTHCAHCLLSAPLKNCARCRTVFFCSRTCQKLHWTLSSHKQTCESSASFSRSLSGALFNDHQKSLAELLCACLLRVTQKEGSQSLNKLVSQPEWPGWQQSAPEGNTYDSRHFLLQCHNGVLRSFSSESLSKLTMILNDHPAMWLVHESERAASSEVRLSAEVVRSLLLRLQMNAFYLTDVTLTPVAAGSFGFGSLLNHSCIPNVFATYDLSTRSQIFRALRPIEKGEELLHSYVDLMQTRFERATLLQDDYAFTCDCRHCTDDTQRRLSVETISEQLIEITTPEFVADFFAGDWARKNVDVDDCLSMDIEGKRVVEPGLRGFEGLEVNVGLQRQLQEACRHLDSEHTLEAYLEALATLAPKFHPLNRSIYSMRCEAYSLALDRSWDELALELAQPIIAVQACVYALIPNHPLCALQLQTYGDLLMAAKHTKRASAVFERVVPALRICYGSDHLFYKLAKEQLDRLQEEGAAEGGANAKGS